MHNKVGFSLIELMVVVVCLSSLLVVGNMSYQHLQVCHNRVAAEQALSRNVSIMQRYYARYGRYDDGYGNWPNIVETKVVGASGVVYNMHLVPAKPMVNSQDYKIIAIPLADSLQANDGNLCIDHEGNVLHAVDNQCGAEPS